MKCQRWMTCAALAALLGGCGDDEPAVDAGMDVATFADKPTNDVGRATDSGALDAGLMDASGGDGGARDAPAATADGEVPAALSDGQIVGVLATVDMGEIAQGNLAQSRAADARARTYGADMVTMHMAASARMTTLAQANGIAPAESPLSQMLRDEATATATRLSALSGAAFDREYVAAQAMQHARVLDVIDSALLPNATNVALRAALQNDVRPMVAMHRQQAADLQVALGSP